MSQLKPKQIILHCGLHKTGSTYLQRNFKSKRETLLSYGILYLGPTTFKKQFRHLWKHLQWKKLKTEPSQKLTDLTLKALMQEAGATPERIHTQIIISEGLNTNQGLHFLKDSVFILDKPKYRQQDGKYKHYPFRFWAGNKLLGGYSDHLATRIVLRKKK